MAALALLTSAASAETVVIEATRDATLIEHPAGALANGSGPVFFAGRTSQAENGVRRALLYFDVSAYLPQSAIIEKVELRLVHMGGNSLPRAVRLHRALEAWSEGASAASGGSGAPSTTGDATWIHAAYDHDLWVRAGGHFVARSSALQTVGASGGYAWESTVHLVQDVRLWNRSPSRNFGWFVIGDETTPQNAKRFASRENPDRSARPALEITYRLPGRR